MTLRRHVAFSGVTVGLLCACSLAACGSAQPVSSSTAQASVVAATAGSTFAPFPTPSGSPPFSPPVITQPPGVRSGAPPITYATPSGFSLDLSTAQLLSLTSATGAEALRFQVDSAQEDVSHASSTMRIGGETGYVVQRGAIAGGYGYEEAVIVSHRGAQYEALCVGYSGYDAGRLSRGCGAFLASIAFTS